jgi:hypothetical protein
LDEFKHGSCTGDAWDTEKDRPTACGCSCHFTPVAPDPAALIETTSRWDYKGPTLDEDDQSKITDLLMGRSVRKVADDHLLLDDGTMLRIMPNEGGCSCGAGDYEIEVLNEVENVITKVEFDYRVDGDDSYLRIPYGDPRREDYGFYRIFVYAGDRKINLLQVNGSDGNGYYGTGFQILVRPASDVEVNNVLATRD